jgi:ubiquitin-protein ligase
LREAGIEYHIDQDALAKGVLVLEVRFPYGDRTVKAKAVFPDYYPEFRPRVFAEPLGLTHHQSPASGDLCLLGRRGDQWQPGYTLAWLLTERMAALAETDHIADLTEAEELEDVQAEPYTAYYRSKGMSAVFVDGEWNIMEDVEGGILLAGLIKGSEKAALRAMVLEVRDFDGNVVGKAPDHIRHMTGAATYEWAWLRKHEPVPFDSPRPIFEEVAQLAKARRIRLAKAKFRGVGVDVIGLLVPEEIGHRQSGEGWIFAMRECRKVRDGRKGSTQVRFRSDYNYVRAAYGGEGDILQRVPSIQPLRDSTIAVIGVGALGGTAAVEFARNAVEELRLLDGDVVEPGPTVRWPLGISATGLAKVDALAAFIRENYPWSRVICYEHELGLPPDGQERRDPGTMAEIIDGASLIFDATARTDVSRLVSLLARSGRHSICLRRRHRRWLGRDDFSLFSRA